VCVSLSFFPVRGSSTVKNVFTLHVGVGASSITCVFGLYRSRGILVKDLRIILVEIEELNIRRRTADECPAGGL
jgi:hypothetical protein